MRQTGLWFLMVLILTGSILPGCNGVSVGYSPVSGCANVDLDPADCPR